MQKNCKNEGLWEWRLTGIKDYANDGKIESGKK